MQGQISMRQLKSAFALAEKRAKNRQNRYITRAITNDVCPLAALEGSVNAVIARALHDTFRDRFVVGMEVGRKRKIDVCLLDEGNVIVALEGKGMVSNSTKKKKPPIDALDVRGIQGKLEKVKADVDGIGGKLNETGALVSHYEIFVPIVYEFYRAGGEDEWFKEAKPWTTDPRYRTVMGSLKNDLTEWFTREDDSFRMIRASERIELVDANSLWKKQSKWLYPKYKSLKAYVSFFAFGRCVRV